MAQNKETNELPAKAIARYTLVIVAILTVTLFFWQIKQALLMALGGVIVAVILAGMARGLRKVLPISRGWSLAGAGIEIVLVIGLFVVLFGSQVVEEFQELAQKLPEQISQLQQTIQDWPLGEQLVDGMENDQGENEENGEQQNGNGEQEEEENNQQMEGAGGMLFQATATIIDVVATFFLVVVIGIFFAANPELYKNGILLLVPKERTERVDEALEVSGQALWQWLMGQLIAMAFVGITVTVGLLIVGVPLALVLGVMAGLFDFVPYIGPIVAAVPGVLLAFAEGPEKALWAGLVYLIAQQIEGYVITPIIQRRKVSLPPGLVILAVVSFGLVFGVPGIVLATPLAVITMVLVGMLYVQDVLGKDIEIPGQK